MLIEFSVDNYRSIKDKVTFSMLATSDSHKMDKNTFQARKYNLLNSVIVYGANASGKSNLLKAMEFMSYFVLNRFKIFQSTDTIEHNPFRLNNSTKDASSKFEIVFIINEIKYRYGFELDSEKVYSEWLFADEKGKEAKLFVKDIDEQSYVNQSKFKEGNRFFDNKNSKINIAENQLLIWKCDQENGEISKSILKWFKSFNIIDGLEHDGYINYTLKKMQNKEFHQQIVSLVKVADIGIDNITLKEEDLDLDFIKEIPIPDEIREELLKKGNFKSVSINTSHKLFDENNSQVGEEIFEIDKDESFGTQKFFKISAPIIDTLREGKIIVIDELDSSLHPFLTRHLIELFHNKDYNKKNAQLIFTTHDTNLLNPQLFRRDQIWFTEKDKYGSTDIYSLSEIKNVRKDDDFEAKYIQGKYGAVPYIGKFEF